MLLTYKNMFPFTIALIGGLVVFANQPDVVIAQYVPPERPRPERTQGGGSRLHNLPIQILSLKSDTTEVVSANLSIISLRQNACIC
ncbi:MAG: hypothetical protein ACOYN8_02530 [Pseudanabaena sp.]|jgi:hypothetical protein